MRTFILSFAFATFVSTFSSRTVSSLGPLNTAVDRETIIPNSYIIKLKDGTKHSVAQAHFDWAQQLHSTRVTEHNELRKRADNQAVLDDEHDFQGLTDTFDIDDEYRAYAIHTDSATIELIRQHPDVELVEEDKYMYASVLSPDPGYVDVQNNQYDEPWGRGRISHQDHENMSWPYTFTKSGLGKGVDVYVLDTGIFAEHVEFEDRVAGGFSAVPGEDVYDFMGHGTHCAGTIAGKTFGIAKLATIVPVKVLGANGVGSVALILKGLNWAVERHLNKVDSGEHSDTFRGSVVSMSLGGEVSINANKAISRLARYGLHFVAAAGNEGQDACSKSPASSPNVTTVGAIDYYDRYAQFSNWGSCVDIAAPGVAIRSAGIVNKTSYAYHDGSSMACPHVSGIVASLLSRQPIEDESRASGSKALTSIKPAQLKADLLSIASKGLIVKESLPLNTTNSIAYNGGSRANYSRIVDRGGWPECCN